MKTLSIFWFRRDLRLTDNHALYQALQSGDPVLPIYIFDRMALNMMEQKDDARVTYVYETLKHLQQQLAAVGSTLLVLYGDVLQVFESLLSQYAIKGVYANSDYEPYGRARDKSVADLLQQHHIPLLLFKDSVIFEKSEVMKADSKPYLLFNYYEKAWRRKLLNTPIVNYASETLMEQMAHLAEIPMPGLNDMGFIRSQIPMPRLTINTNVIEHYQDTRNYPFIPGTTHLGVHLHFGTVSIRQLVHLGLLLNEKWLSELIWRDFFIMLLYHFPKTAQQNFKSEFDNMRWSNNMEHFRAWCRGETGYALVDSGMRQLNKTGFMHGRVRMVAASFLVKNLLIDWRLGEHYFAQHLLDYDLALNVGNWQWVAGTGADAMSYFKFLNPLEQAKKYDAQGLYTAQWPDDEPGVVSKPIVDYNISKQHALHVYSIIFKTLPDDMD